MRDILFNKGYFNLWNSAYATVSFVIPPNDLTDDRTSEDNFNCYHSSARVTGKCELNMMEASNM